MTLRRPTTRMHLPMDRETPPQQGACGGFSWTYAYSRSDETRGLNETGQDCLALRCNGERLVFALCDGVGESFYGDLAARFLAGALLKWLWTFDMTGRGHAEVPVAMNQLLASLTGPASRRVLRHPLPEALSPLVRDVLEKKRRQGSQTTFVCARLDLPGPNLPEGGFLAAGIGDTRLRFRGPGGQAAAGMLQLHTPGRWSTRLGVTGGAVSVLPATPLKTVRYVTAYTDGLAALDAQRTPPPADVLAGQMRPPLEDDCCFVSIATGRKEQPLVRT